MGKLLTIVSLCLLASVCEAANILAVFAIASPSHHIWNSPLVVALANRGHNVTVVSGIPQKTKLPNLTDIVISNFMEETQEEFNYLEMNKISVFAFQDLMVPIGGEMCRKVIKSDAWKKLMDYPPETKFDLIIVELECGIGSLSKFGTTPIVWTNAYHALPWYLEMTGTPIVISHMPFSGSELTEKMTFMERALNLVYTAYGYYTYHYRYLPELDKMEQEKFGRVPSTHEMLKRVSLLLTNIHPVLDYSWAMTPSVIPVAGIQVQEAKPLPQDLQKFLDTAKEGAILFSLGTNVKSESLPLEMRQAILDTFEQIPQKVLWKFEKDILPSHTKNVKIAKWLPQSDILAHPNIKLFISHSGLLSTHEAVYRGVPIIGIPVFADQPTNIQKIVNHRAGIRINLKDLTKKNLLAAINNILTDPSYRENMKKLSSIFRDYPETPLERAVSGVEYVLRHNGAYHMRSAALDLNTVQYFLLDVIAFVLAIPLIALCTLYYICCRRRSKLHLKLKRN